MKQYSNNTHMPLQITYSLDQLDAVVDQLYAMRDQCAVFTFTGPLGAGKTTLIRALLARWGYEGAVTSPTFTYMHAYRILPDKIVYHFDLYRMKSIDDFMGAGFDEYLFAPQSWALIEWPEIIAPILSQRVCHCTIDYAGADKRIITITSVF